MPREPLIHAGLKLDTWYFEMLSDLFLYPLWAEIFEWWWCWTGTEYTLVVVSVYHRSTTSSWDGIEVNRVLRTSAECSYDLWKKYHFSFASI